MVTKLDLRHAISFFLQQQIILDKVDSVSHKHTDSESRRLLLGALKEPSVKLLDIYRKARTHGDNKFDSFEKLKIFLTTAAFLERLIELKPLKIVIY